MIEKKYQVRYEPAWQMYVERERPDSKTDVMLRKLAKRTGRSKSDVIRDALRRQLALTRFSELRQSAVPFAAARGWHTDQDVFREVS